LNSEELKDNLRSLHNDDAIEKVGDMFAAVKLLILNDPRFKEPQTKEEKKLVAAYRAVLRLK
jgi:hypothetical protein